MPEFISSSRSQSHETYDITLPKAIDIQPDYGAKRPECWWERLGLKVDDRSKRLKSFPAQKAVEDLLKAHLPASFITSDDGTSLTFNEFLAVVDTTVKDAEGEAQARLEALEAGHHVPVAEDDSGLVTEGDWAGFTRARAMEWCWLMLTDEPVYSQNTNLLVLQSKARMEVGILPNFPRLAARAKDLALRGVTPQQYRHHMEAGRAERAEQRDNPSLCTVCDTSHAEV